MTGAAHPRCRSIDLRIANDLWPSDPTAIDRLRRYRDLILDQNRQFNLTAIRDPGAIDRNLILESLRLLATVDDCLAADPADRPLLATDIGSGAGIPGVPLAIVRPSIHFTLIEATGKKARFLDQVASELELEHVEVIHRRSEEVAHDPRFREKFDFVFARAVTNLPALAELALPLLRIGGRAYFPKGEHIEDEIARGQRAAQLLGGRIHSANLLTPIECLPVTRLVILDKIETTSRRYPRRAGIPEHEPLGE